MERTRNWEKFYQWKMEKCQSNIMKWTYKEFGKYTQKSKEKYLDFLTKYLVNM